MWNYKTPAFESERPTSIKQQLDMVYGKKANEYIEQMLTDINGGVTKQAGVEFVNKMIGLIKKNSVFASLSVAVQQPSALGRAMAYVSPKYFVGKQPKGTWEEIQKYAPVAIVKEMGYFDTGMGRQAVEWMNETRYEGLKKAFALFYDGNYRDDVLSMLPSFMDEITWGRIWVAVKNETKAKNQISTMVGKYGDDLNWLAGVYQNGMTVVPNPPKKDSDQLKNELSYINNQIPIIALKRELTSYAFNKLLGIE